MALTDLVKVDFCFDLLLFVVNELLGMAMFLKR